MLPSSIELHIVAPGQNATRYLRFMNGREVRARVLRGGDNNGRALLRLGDVLLNARIRGRSLKSGETIYIRIEKKNGNKYSLVVLDRGMRIINNLLSRKIPPELWAFLVRLLIDEKSVKSAGIKNITVSNHRRADEKKAGVLLNKIINKMLIPKLDKSDCLYRPLMCLSQFAVDPDVFFAREWPLDDDMESLQQNVKNEFNQSSNEKDIPAQRRKDLLLGWGFFKEAPFSFFLHLDFIKAGKLNILFLSDREDFMEMDVYIFPSKKETSDAIRKIISGWKNTLKEMGSGIRDVILLDAQSEFRGQGTIDLQA